MLDSLSGKIKCDSKRKLAKMRRGGACSARHPMFQAVNFSERATRDAEGQTAMRRSGSGGLSTHEPHSSGCITPPRWLRGYRPAARRPPGSSGESQADFTPGTRDCRVDRPKNNSKPIKHDASERSHAQMRYDGARKTFKTRTQNPNAIKTRPTHLPGVLYMAKAKSR